jgi:hypothetical protein
MKIAVIGASPIGIETAIHFSQMGAFVRVFEQSEVGGSLHFELPETPMVSTWAEISTAEGRSQINFHEDLKVIPTTKEYLEKYLLPLAQHFSLSKNLIKAKVERVHKRFLSLHEEVKGHSRLFDLFRVVYSLEPIVVDEDNAEAYENLAEKLGQNLIESLKHSMEYYEDFDLVIDCTGYSLCNPLGPSCAYAIGEKRIQHEPEMIYGLQALQGKVLEGHEIALVGCSAQAATALIKMKQWLNEANHFLTIISSDSDWLSSLASPYLKHLCHDILTWSESLYNKEKDQFMAKMEDWKNLDDFVRVKMPRPVESRKKIAIFEACDVTSVDKLIDQPKIFLTLENPDFRKNVLKEDLVTYGFDQVIVMNKNRRDQSLFEGLRSNEVGFYTFNELTLSGAILHLNEIEKDVLKFFSRA